MISAVWVWRGMAGSIANTHIGYRDKLLVMLKLDPDTVALETGFSRDVRDIGTWGTGDLELTLRSRADMERALPLLERSYTEN